LQEAVLNDPANKANINRKPSLNKDKPLVTGALLDKNSSEKGNSQNSDKKLPDA